MVWCTIGYRPKQVEKDEVEDSVFEIARARRKSQSEVRRIMITLRKLVASGTRPVASPV